MAVRDNDYVVILGNVIVPVVTEITMMKNLLNDNPRGVIDVSLAGTVPPGYLIVKTKTNIEDFFRLNIPLILLKKLPTQGSMAAESNLFDIAAYAHLTYTKYYDFQNITFAPIIALGYLPVFVGVAKSYHTVYGNSGDSVDYINILSGLDLGSFLYEPVSSLPSKKFGKKDPDPDDTNKWMFRSPEAGIESVVSNPNFNNISRGKMSSAADAVARQEFTNATVAWLLSLMPQYKKYLNTGLGTVGGVASAAYSGFTSDEITSALLPLLSKGILGLKVPKDAEPIQEAIPLHSIESNFQRIIDGDNIVTSQESENANGTIADLIKQLCPNFLYESFVREDTGEFVFRRASWMPTAKLSSLGVKQIFLNPRLPVVMPTKSIKVYQKVYGGRLGEVVGDEVYTRVGFVIDQDKMEYQMGPKNRQKFGSALFYDPWIFGTHSNIHTFREDELVQQYGLKKLVNSSEFYADQYYKIADTLKPTSDKNPFETFSQSNKGGAKKIKEASDNIATWIGKYHHSVGAMIWLGYSTYFPCPLGSTVAWPIAGIPANTLSQGLNSLQNLVGKDPFVSYEFLTTYRIIAKSLKIQYRYDGSYTEDYNLLLGNALTGMEMSK